MTNIPQTNRPFAGKEKEQYIDRGKMTFGKNIQVLKEVADKLEEQIVVRTLLKYYFLFLFCLFLLIVTVRLAFKI